MEREPEDRLEMNEIILDITESFRPEYVTRLCKKHGLIAGDSFDLRDGYDLSDDRMQALVIAKISKTQPTSIIGSSRCTLFSVLQKLNLHAQGPGRR